MSEMSDHFWIVHKSFWSIWRSTCSPQYCNIRRARDSAEWIFSCSPPAPINEFTTKGYFPSWQTTLQLSHVLLTWYGHFSANIEPQNFLSPLNQNTNLPTLAPTMLCMFLVYQSCVTGGDREVGSTVCPSTILSMCEGNVVEHVCKSCASLMYFYCKE